MRTTQQRARRARGIALAGVVPAAVGVVGLGLAYGFPAFLIGAFIFTVTGAAAAFSVEENLR